MGVPSHDERDARFGTAHGLPHRRVVHPPPSKKKGKKGGKGEEKKGTEDEGVFTMDGILKDSGPYTGLSSAEARREMVKAAEAEGVSILHSLQRFDLTSCLPVGRSSITASAAGLASVSAEVLGLPHPYCSLLLLWSSGC